VFRTRVLSAAALIAASSFAGVAYADSVPDPSSTEVARANCGPGSDPETGLQGQVPLVERQDGRSRRGYSCNLELQGRYQGEGSSWVSPSYGHCAYLSTAFAGLGTLTKRSQGVQVVDVSDPGHPRRSATLTSPGMLTGTWESLKVNERRGLLAGVSGGPVMGALFFDVYDIKQDCAHPRLLNKLRLGSSGGGGSDGLPLIGSPGGRVIAESLKPTLPANILGHEGGWAPDGRTYYATSGVGSLMTAIDVSDPDAPRIIYEGLQGLAVNHGLSVSRDGDRLYLARAFPAGFLVLDVSDIQQRRQVPTIRQVSETTWDVLGVGQATIPISYGGTPHLVTFDEFAAAGPRIYDISDERRPRLVRQLTLETQQDRHVEDRRADTTGNGLFGYDTHYCAVDREEDPTALACGYFQSGIRVFDIRDPRKPRELAYFNPPAQVGRNLELGGSEHAAGIAAQTAPAVSDLQHLNVGRLTGVRPFANLTADYCTSPPRFVGTDQLWVSCQDNGFLALKFTNDAYEAR
jgi:hypothetical protein